MTRMVDAQGRPLEYLEVNTVEEGALLFFARDPAHARRLAREAGYQVRKASAEPKDTAA